MYYLGLVLIVSLCNIDPRVEVEAHWWDGVYRDTKSVVSSPLRWTQGDWLKVGFGIATTCGFMSQDERLQDWAQERRTSTRDRVATLLEPLGSEGAVILLASGYLWGWIIGSPRLEKMALLGVESAGISTAILLSLKFLTGRSRPYIEDNAQSYSPFNIHSSHHSFPSGHTGAAFSIASCAAEECNNTLISVLSYGTATLVGLSRIYNNKHWTSDVLVGSIIGIAVGRTVVKLNQ